MAAQAFLDAMAEKGISTDKGTIGMQMNMENAALDFEMRASVTTWLRRLPA